MASTQDKLKRVRKPRVHITYEVETGGARVERELPFVVGVLGDFSGNPDRPLQPLKQKKFTEIDRDNFNSVMAEIAPELNFKVENTIAGDGSEMAVNLKFNDMSDFEPAKIANQVEPLKRLLETRARLNDLMTKVDRSEELEGLLEQILQDPDAMKRLQGELGVGGDEPAAGGSDASDEGGE
ncbi:MAG: type VI secretion system contractile sheath small subunit [Planctomycetota bacterium]